MALVEPTPAYCISLDDDPMIYRIIQEITKLQTLPFVSGIKLLERAAAYRPVVVFVDIHLGHDESGLAVLPKLREIWPRAPLLVMTADESSALIGQALSLGANDFLRKPLVPAEVQARVQARIFEMQQRQTDDRLEIGDMIVDCGRRSLAGPLGRRFLSESEWCLLSCLLEVRGMMVAKADLKGRVWGDIAVSDNAVDRKLMAVRQALRDVSTLVQISTQYGKGVSVEVKAKGAPSAGASSRARDP